MSSVVNFLQKQGNYNTLLSLLNKSGLDLKTLSHRFTLFAPNDQAFAKLPPQFLANLQKPENKAALQNFLKYHMVNGQFKPNNVNIIDVNTMNGESIKGVKVSNGQTTVGAANVTKTNSTNDNNYTIHAIDTPLIPPSMTTPPVLIPAPTTISYAWWGVLIILVILLLVWLFAMYSRPRTTVVAEGKSSGFFSYFGY